MITFEELIEAARDPKILALDVDAFGPADIVNIILQRSEIIRDQHRPGKIVNAWAEGDDAPALALAEKMGSELVRRAAAIIWLEYLEVKDTIQQIEPKSVADIGCGYAIFDLFLWQDFQSRLVLIDLETTQKRHFGFKETGAAYSSLDTAKQFLSANGVPDSQIHLRNPKDADLNEDPKVDLAVSFISCGFHYPVETYLEYFKTNVSADGGVILDFRARKARAGIETLKALGEVSILTDAAYGNARRVLLRKGAM